MRCINNISALKTHAKFSCFIFLHFESSNKRKTTSKNQETGNFPKTLNKIINTYNYHHQFNLKPTSRPTQSHYICMYMAGETVSAIRDEVSKQLDSFHTILTEIEHKN